MFRYALLFSFALTVTLEPVFKINGNQTLNEEKTTKEVFLQNEEREEKQEEEEEKIIENENNRSFHEEMSAIAMERVECGKYTTWFVRTVVFLPIVRFKIRGGILNLFRDLSDPADYGISNGKNFRIPTVKGSLGAWFIWPQGSSVTSLSELRPRDTLIVYMHGNSDSRGFGDRIQLYSVLTKMGYYVLSFDYRGFGDSTKVHLSETTLVSDSLNVLTWATNSFKKSSGKGPLLVVWGHSLGTSIATITTNKWQALDKYLISGLVLEAAFNTMEDEAQYLGGALVSWLNLNVSAELKCADAEFRSVDYLLNITAPTLALHAEDDTVVPVHLELFKSAVAGGKTNIRFINYDKKYNLNHNHIFSATTIDQDLKEFFYLVGNTSNADNLPTN
ncbi:monoacylglycerol lipase ABHD12 isoform X2 [Eurytemora carolleeae]|uniref:monoacylglycerol lipase ABHD12 isoform X2 n=1 Tax=Eurytemora carolleeae TaxID=1294199 RepID=UPI000C784448|nr:monoacylglycerol lipase ABHD12 isoform X2 [Eurytemora carolleeae]|eukprot:XP_023344264.1 monoacylglycerol lipase ABHD12-like isoform X2 [Eurytemora affinis]